MIQRLQSVYLFLVAALVATCMFMPLTTIVTPEDTVILSSLGAYAPAPESKLLFEMWPLTIVAALAALLSLINIFLFRNRPLQMRVCHFTTWFLVAFYVIVGIYIYDLYIALNGESLQLQAALSMPVVALVLNYIAYRRIRADERLVRSADRLR